MVQDRSFAVVVVGSDLNGLTDGPIVWCYMATTYRITVRAGHQPRPAWPTTTTWLTFPVLLAATVPATLPLVPDTHLRGGEGVRRPDDRDVGIYNNAGKVLVLAEEKHRVADKSVLG